MKKLIILVALAVLAGSLLLGSGTIRETAAELSEYIYGDPDMPFNTGMSKEEYMLRRSEQIGLLRGIDKDHPSDPQARMSAIRTLEQQESFRSSQPNSFAPNAQNDLLTAWTPIGPNPIPNGQTTGVSVGVSGRVTAIDVHPTNPNIAYVGTALGGLYRTLDGGVTWTPLMDNALSLAIGAVTIDPVNPTKVFVGTGEGNTSLDSFAGVGLYRIDNADTAPIVNGPFETRVAGTGTGASNGHSFNGTAINRIAVDPANDNRIFVGNTYGFAGIGGIQQSIGSSSNGFIGLYFSENALAATPTFSRVSNAVFNGLQAVTDIVFEPGSSSNMLIGVENFDTDTNHGVYRSTDATSASVAGGVAPGLTRTLTTGQVNIKLAVNKVAGVVTALAATETSNGRLLRSTDGGVTWPTTLTAVNGFCGGQCWYDIALAIDPTDANNIYLGGSAAGASSFLMKRSTNAGANFTAVDTGLHADMHAIAIAPNNPAVAYVGNDGGVWQSSNANTATPANVSWTSRNNSTFIATQFMSVDVHPTDPNITIGGTQDNGSNRYKADGTWTRTDFGDGGFAVIDQSSSDTTTFNQYHTYFNGSTLTGYAFSNSGTAFENWTFRGCSNPPPNTKNGITCTGTVNFYAPLERGPGTPNSIYYGADRLYRSVDTGSNNATVSQTFTSPISAIGVSPQNDNVRVIGRNDGGIFGTVTGANPLVDLDPANTIPASYIARAVIDPNDQNTAYITLTAFGVVSIWKTTNLSSSPPTWTAAAGSGPNSLPQIPVNAFAVDPLNSNLLYAGTDIGVYASGDAGATWTPFGTGLPRVAVFDMAISSGRMLRIATHGRGLYQIPLFGPTAAPVSVAGRVVSPSGMGVRNATVSLKSDTGDLVTARTNTFGYFRFDSIRTGQTYVLNVQAKGYSFAPRPLSFTSDVTDLVIYESTSQTSSPLNRTEQPAGPSINQIEMQTSPSETGVKQPINSSVTKLTVVNAGSTKAKRKLRKHR